MIEFRGIIGENVLSSVYEDGMDNKGLVVKRIMKWNHAVDDWMDLLISSIYCEGFIYLKCWCEINRETVMAFSERIFMLQLCEIFLPFLISA